jgi:hypothetical protein
MSVAREAADETINNFFYSSATANNLKRLTLGWKFELLKDCDYFW